jgi:hypothetical protein
MLTGMKGCLNINAKQAGMKIRTQILIITLPAAKSCMALLSLFE